MGHAGTMGGRNIGPMLRHVPLFQYLNVMMPHCSDPPMLRHPIVPTCPIVPISQC
jgi:hypothetical protein